MIVGSLIVGLLIGAGVMFVAAPSIVPAKTSTISGSTVTTTAVTTAAASGLCNGQTITIGALNDLSSQLSSQGHGDVASENSAIKDVNSFLTSSGCNMKFALDGVDYKLDNPTALTQLTAMFASGIQVVVGPLNSGTAGFLLQYANSNHIVMISPSSTNPNYHVTDTTNNYLFRTAPNDGAQGQAVAREIVTQGNTAVVIVNRQDSYGNGLANATRSFLEADGISASNIAGPFAYDFTSSDYSSLISQINSAYNTLNTGANTGHVAIFCISFQEIGTILAQAKSSNSPIYTSDVPWYGSDGTAQNTLLVNSTTGPSMAHIVLPSTLYNVVNNTKTIAWVNSLSASDKAAVASNFFYSLEGYNDVWLAALSIMTAGQNSGTAIHAVFTSVADSFYGLTGWEGLCGNDRCPGSYQIWKVVASGSGDTWVLAGSWDFNTDKVTWISPP